MDDFLEVGEAFRAFARWRSDHDPDEKMEIDEAAVAYYLWSETHSIAPYLDAATKHQEPT